jgi:hypothetical protein
MNRQAHIAGYLATTILRERDALTQAFSFDEFGEDYNENHDPQTGEFSSGGGGGSGKSHDEVVAGALKQKLGGNKAERADLRKVMNDPKTTPQQREELKKRIGESTAFQVNKLREKNPAKAELIHSGLLKMGYTMEGFGFKPFGAKVEVSVPKVSVAAPKPVTGSLGQVVEKPASGLASKHGMTAAEETSLRGYTGSHYVALNTALRAGMMTEQQYVHVANINRALGKLPNMVGTVYRGRKDSAAHLYKEGMIVEERGFTSTSTNEMFSVNWAGGPTGTKFQITSKTGKSVKDFSQHPQENEVLFKSGSRFKVTKVSGSTVHMVEVGDVR